MALKGYVIFLGVALVAVIGFTTALPVIASQLSSVSENVVVRESSAGMPTGELPRTADGHPLSLFH